MLPPSLPSSPSLPPARLLAPSRPPACAGLDGVAAVPRLFFPISPPRGPTSTAACRGTAVVVVIVSDGRGVAADGGTAAQGRVARRCARRPGHRRGGAAGGVRDAGRVGARRGREGTRRGADPREGGECAGARGVRDAGRCGVGGVVKEEEESPRAACEAARPRDGPRTAQREGSSCGLRALGERECARAGAPRARGE